MTADQRPPVRLPAACCPPTRCTTPARLAAGRLAFQRLAYSLLMLPRSLAICFHACRRYRQPVQDRGLRQHGARCCPAGRVHAAALACLPAACPERGRGYTQGTRVPPTHPATCTAPTPPLPPPLVCRSPTCAACWATSASSACCACTQSWATTPRPCRWEPGRARAWARAWLRAVLRAGLCPAVPPASRRACAQRMHSLSP